MARKLGGVCQAPGCDNPHAYGQRFCGERCRHRARRRAAGMREYEPPLSPYWKEYLRRFDRAILERTPDAWAACHEMAPAGGRRQIPPDPEFAQLLWSLEEG